VPLEDWAPDVVIDTPAEAVPVDVIDNTRNWVAPPKVVALERLFIEIGPDVLDTCVGYICEFEA
jgi:hypothetical protein